MSVVSGVTLAGQPSIASSSELNDGLVFVRTLVNDDGITWHEPAGVVNLVVRTIEAQNVFAVERARLKAWTEAGVSLSGMSVVSGLVVPLTDGISCDGRGIRGVKP